MVIRSSRAHGGLPPPLLLPHVRSSYVTEAGSVRSKVIACIHSIHTLNTPVRRKFVTSEVCRDEVLPWSLDRSRHNRGVKGIQEWEEAYLDRDTKKADIVPIEGREGSGSYNDNQT